MKITERDVQRFLYRANHTRFKVLLPNYTPLGWWECDLFGVTKSGYFHEFEIKLTMADFRRDAKKASPTRRQWENGQYVPVPGVQKHSMIGQAAGPSMFWYVVGDGMDVLDELPEWAGLQTVFHGNHVRIVRQPPRLHRVKIADTIVRHAQGVCYYRYWHERQAHDAARRDYHALRETAAAK